MGGIYSFGLIVHWWLLFYIDLLYMGANYLLGLIVHGCHLYIWINGTWIDLFILI